MGILFLVNMEFYCIREMINYSISKLRQKLVIWKKIKIISYLIPYYNIYSRWIKGLNVKELKGKSASIKCEWIFCINLEWEKFPTHQTSEILSEEFDQSWYIKQFNSMCKKILPSPNAKNKLGKVLLKHKRMMNNFLNI